jgi:succinoglycan biosynthesis transport protein ExoP
MDSSKTPSPQEAKLHFLDYWRIIRIRKTVILAVFLLVVITATVVTFITDPTYMGKARVNVQKEAPDITPGVGGNAIQPFGVDPFFIQTEFEVMKSQVVLGKVVELKNLTQTWATKYGNGEPLSVNQAIEILQSHIDLVPVRNTSIIEIRYKSDSPDEAADMANAIAEAYRDHREEASQVKMKEGIKSLKEDLDKQESELRVAQSNVDYLRVALHVEELDPQSDMPSPTLSSSVMQKLQGDVVELQGQEAKLETQLGKLRPLSRKELRGTIQTVMEPDSVLGTLLNELDIAEQNFQKLQKDLRPDHPDYQKAQQLVDDLNKKIDDRVDYIMFGWETKLASLQAWINSQTNQLAAAVEKDLQTAARTRPYYEAKRKLMDMQEYRKLLELKIKSTATELNLPHKMMVDIVDRAVKDTRAVSPNKPLNIIIGIIVGLVVGVGLAFFIEYLDTSVKTIDDVERTLQAPVLGVIPQNVGFLLEEGAESPHAEAYRVLRTNLLFSRKEEKLNTVAVVSAGAGEGKSTTIFNLAAVFAQNGSRVVIVDSDLRRPTLHKMLGVTNSLGLTNYLLKQNSLEQVIQTTNLPTLDFMASGKLPSSSLGILSSSAMRDLITELKRRYDFVFFDSPPIMGVSDASILASEVDMTLQVIQYRRYPQPMNIRAKQMIEKVGGNLIGIVLNNINVSQDENYYYYSGYYNEYYSKTEEAEPVAAGDGEKNKTEIKPKY